MIDLARTVDGPAAVERGDRFVDIDGARLRYRDEGAGPAVALVHGWTLDLDMWEPQVAALAPAFRVIRYDRRGFGLSSGNPSSARDVSDLAALCRHLRVQRAALVGMSQGARVVLQVADESPALVSCLVLDGAPRWHRARDGNGWQELPYEHYRWVAQVRGMAAFRLEWAQHPLVKLKSADAGARRLLARMLERYSGKDLQEPPGRPAEVARPSIHRSIDVPTLVVGGALDIASRRRIAGELLLELPRAERAEIPDAGHLCNLDNPRAYNSILRDFLERHAAAAAHHPRATS